MSTKLDFFGISVCVFFFVFIAAYNVQMFFFLPSFFGNCSEYPSAAFKDVNSFTKKWNAVIDPRCAAHNTGWHMCVFVRILTKRGHITVFCGRKRNCYNMLFCCPFLFVFIWMVSIAFDYLFCFKSTLVFSCSKTNVWSQLLNARLFVTYIMCSCFSLLPLEIIIVLELTEIGAPFRWLKATLVASFSLTFPLIC